MLCAIRSGNSIQKVLPTATVLVTPISPPINSTNRRAIDSPSPVPPKRRVVDPSACVNGVNKRSSAAGSMPMPVSCTVQRRRKRSDVRSAQNTFNSTWPASVNLIELPRRLVRIWRRRDASPLTLRGKSGAD